MLNEDDPLRWALRVLAATVVETMIGRLGLDFNGLVSLLALQCRRNGEANGSARAFRDGVAFLRSSSAFASLGKCCVDFVAGLCVLGDTWDAGRMV